MTTETWQSIGKRIKELRTTLGITMESLAERNDLSTSFIWDVENGKKACSLKTLGCIAKSLQTSVPELLANVKNDDTILNRALYRKIEGLPAKEKAKLLKTLDTLTDLLK